jgi:radical SAM protein with 4Fe4S-binding SPASM domain
LKFDVPVRIRWDADPPPDLAREGFAFEKAESILRAILEASPLSLDITIVSEEVLDKLLNLLKATKAPVSVSLYLSENIVQVREDGSGGHGRSGRIFFHGKNCSELPEERFWYAPDPRDYGETFELLDAFLRSPGKLLVLKNPNYRKNALPAEITPPDFDSLRERVHIDNGHFGNDKRVVIHDYFLWKFFRDNYHGFVDERAEFDGCQGGSTLAYIDWNGCVYPCETLLVHLGTLPGENILKIWDSSERKAISEKIQQFPPDCVECGELRGCFGGCRGLAHHIRGRLDFPDPQCDK